MKKKKNFPALPFWAWAGWTGVCAGCQLGRHMASPFAPSPPHPDHEPQRFHFIRHKFLLDIYWFLKPFHLKCHAIIHFLTYLDVAFPTGEKVSQGEKKKSLNLYPLQASSVWNELWVKKSLKWLLEGSARVSLLEAEWTC